MTMKADVIEAPDYLPDLYVSAGLMYGPNVAKAALQFYGRTTDPANVPDSNWYDCQARFVMLFDRKLPVLPPVIEAPRVANTPTEARLLKLEFAEAKRKRQAKADALWDALGAACDRANLGGDGYDISHVLETESPVDAKRWCMIGLAGMTYGRNDNPCIRGLAALEAILKAAPAIGPAGWMFEDRESMRADKVAFVTYRRTMGKITDPKSEAARSAGFALERRYAENYAAFQTRYKAAREFE